MQADIVDRLHDVAERVGGEYCVNTAEGWVWPCSIMRKAAVEITRLREALDAANKRAEDAEQRIADLDAEIARLREERDELRIALTFCE